MMPVFSEVAPAAIWMRLGLPKLLVRREENRTPWREGRWNNKHRRIRPVFRLDMVITIS